MIPGNGHDLGQVPTSALVSGLVSEAQRVASETQHLLKAEIALAKEELRKDVAETTTAAGLFGIAGAVGYAAVLCLTAGAILLLALVMPAWGAALVVGVLLAALGVVLGLAGKSTLSRVKFFDETAAQVKEDMGWASETMRKARSRSRVIA